ncbi:MAG: hypothetical protein AAB932_04965 [Patescibacteria group bacterium]
MFGRKKKTNESDAQKDIGSISVIPEVFYGGKDPLIYHPEKEASSALLTKKTEKRGSEQKNKPPRSPSGGLFKKKWVWITTGSIVFVLAIAGISWYYIQDAKNQLLARVPVQEETEPITPSPTSSRPGRIATSSPSTPPIATTTIAATTTPPPVSPTSSLTSGTQRIQFPRTAFLNSPDLDNDELTDVEEELFGTDSGAWDTDSDGYYDGQEVANLYNPKGTAPIRIIDSGLIREYQNPVFGYRVYYPLSWEAAAVDSGAETVLISAAEGDYLAFHAIRKQAGESFQAWFGRVAIGERFTNLRPFTNRFAQAGYMRNDGLVAYVEDADAVFVIIYQPGPAPSIPYRHVMQMAVASFRVAKSNGELPTQPIIPPAPVAGSATSSGQ